MNFTQTEIQILREANEILTLHKLNGCCISKEYVSQQFIDWVNNSSLGFKTFEMSPLEVITAYYDANPYLEKLQQVREIELYQLGHNKKVCYISEHKMNEEQLKGNDMFQYFKHKAYLHIGFVPNAGIITWKLFCKKSPTEMQNSSENAYHIQFFGSFNTDYSGIEETSDSDIKFIADFAFFKENILAIEKEKFVSKHNDMIVKLSTTQE